MKNFTIIITILMFNSTKIHAQIKTGQVPLGYQLVTINDAMFLITAPNGPLVYDNISLQLDADTNIDINILGEGYVTYFQTNKFNIKTTFIDTNFEFNVIDNQVICLNFGDYYPCYFVNDVTLKDTIIGQSYVSYFSNPFLSTCSKWTNQQISLNTRWSQYNCGGFYISNGYLAFRRKYGTNKYLYGWIKISTTIPIPSGIELTIHNYTRLPAFYTEIYDTINCNGVYTFGNGVTISNFYKDTIYNFVLPSLVTGGDSLVRTFLKVNIASFVSNSDSIIKGSTYMYFDSSTAVISQNQTVHASYFTAQNGCDSVLETILNVYDDFKVYNPNLLNRFCIGNTMQLQADAYGGKKNYSYLWQPSIGLSDTTSATTSFTVSNNITYTCTVTDALAQTTSITYNIIVDTPISNMHIISSSLTFCADSIKLSNDKGIAGKWYKRNNANTSWVLFKTDSIAISYAPSTFYFQSSFNACVSSPLSDTLNIPYTTNITSENLTICADQLPYMWQGKTILSPGIYYDTIHFANGCDSAISLQLSLYPYTSTYVSTFAGGSLTVGIGQDTAAGFNNLFGMGSDAFGNIYVCENIGMVNYIRKINATAYVSAVTYTPNIPINPRDVIADTAGNLFFTDYQGHCIRKISPNGVISFFAGSTISYNGFLDGQGTAALFNNPTGITIDKFGNLYVIDLNNAIRKITPGGYVSTFATLASFSCFCDFNSITCDKIGNVYVGDFNKIYKISTYGNVSTLVWAASGLSPYFDLITDSLNNIYAISNNKVFKISPIGVITTLAGSSIGLVNGPADAAKFGNLRGITINPQGEIFVADNSYKVIRKIKQYVTITKLISQTACGSFFFNNQTLLASGSYQDTFATSNGCDSIIILNLKINPVFDSTSIVSICSNQLPYTWLGQSYFTSGTYTQTFLSSKGCDSVSNLQLTVNLETGSIFNFEICSNQLPYSWLGQNYSTSGSYSQIFQNVFGCDSIAYLQLIVNPSTSTNDTVSICSNQLPYTWLGQNYFVSGNYTQTLQNTNGCDSNITLDLIINTIPTLSIITNPTTSNVCFGDSISVNALGVNNYSWSNGVQNNINFSPYVTTTYSVIGSDINGCTNTASIIINIDSLPTISIIASPNDSICNGENLLLQANATNASLIWSSGISNNIVFTPASSAIYTVVATGNNLCTSSAVQNIMVLPNIIPSISIISSILQGAIGTPISYTASTNVPSNYIIDWYINAVYQTTTFTNTWNTNIVSGNNNITASIKSTEHCLQPDSVISNELFINNNTAYTNFTLKLPSIYPNPFSNFIQIEEIQKNDIVSIYNMLGQKISTTKGEILLKNKNQIITENISNGVYLITINKGIEIFNFRLIKK